MARDTDLNVGNLEGSGIKPSNVSDLPGGSLFESQVLNKRGQNSDYPAVTTKHYAGNSDLRTAARLLIPIAGTGRSKSFLDTVTNQEARGLSKHLVQDGEGTALGGYVDFLLQSANESYQEKVQVVDVLSDNYVALYFGAAPPTFSYSAILLNTYQDDWRAAFSILYQHVLRGSQLARRQVLVTLAYDNVAVTGTMVNLSQQMTAEGQMHAMANFSILVKRYDIYRLPGTTPTRSYSQDFRQVDVKSFYGLRLAPTKRSMLIGGSPVFDITAEESKKQEKKVEAKTGTTSSSGTYNGGVGKTQKEIDEEYAKQVNAAEARQIRH